MRLKRLNLFIISHPQKYYITSSITKKKDEISEDDMKKQQDAIQKATDKFIADIDSLLAEKEKDILKV